jgi:hypothetical protein
MVFLWDPKYSPRSQTSNSLNKSNGHIQLHSFPQTSATATATGENMYKGDGDSEKGLIHPGTRIAVTTTTEVESTPAYERGERNAEMPSGTNFHGDSNR